MVEKEELILRDIEANWPVKWSDKISISWKHADNMS